MPAKKTTPKRLKRLTLRLDKALTDIALQYGTTVSAELQAAKDELSRLGDETLMAEARKAAGPFQPSSQREGRPLFEGGTVTICPGCNMAKKVEDCVWSDSDAASVKALRGMLLNVPQLPPFSPAPFGTCKACLLLVPIAPPEPPKKPERKSATVTARRKYPGWKFAEGVVSAGTGDSSTFYRCDVCNYEVREADLKAMSEEFGTRECPSCVRRKAEAVLASTPEGTTWVEGDSRLYYPSEVGPVRYMGRSSGMYFYGDQYVWTSVADTDDGVMRDPGPSPYDYDEGEDEYGRPRVRKPRKPKPEPTLKRQPRMVTLPDD